MAQSTKRRRPNQLNLRISDKARECLRRLADKYESNLTEALNRAILTTARHEGVYPKGQ